jgi:BlaI family transcriptional regulator, penicillinase repressor
MPTPPTLPTPAELEVLQLLWRRGPLPVREVHDAIRQSRDVGYTTVLKTMQVMTEKRLLVRNESARSHVYTPAVKADPIQRHFVAAMLDGLFEGSAESLVMQALSVKPASKAEMKAIKALLDKQLSKGGNR